RGGRSWKSEAGASHLEGAHHGAGLVDALDVLLLRDRIGDHAGADLDLSHAAAQDDGTDEDAGAEIALVIEVEDAAAVGAAAGGFELLDDLHGADLGRTGEGAGGKTGGQGVEAVAAGAEQGADIGDQVLDVGVLLDAHQRGDGDGTDGGNAADVVAAEIHEHDMLSALFLVGEELAGEFGVEGFGGAAGAGASDGPVEDLILLVDLDEEFGRSADEGGIAELEEEHVGRRIDGAQGAVDLEGGNLGGHVEAQG